MAELTHQYKQRVLGYVQGAPVLKLLAATPRQITRLVEAASPVQLKRRPAPGKWSAGEILAHLADGEMVIGYRMRLIASQPGTAIHGYDQNAWAANLNYAGRKPKAALSDYLALRAINLDWLKSLSPAIWNNVGLHNERGPESLQTVAELLAGHDINHLRQIQALLAP